MQPDRTGLPNLQRILSPTRWRAPAAALLMWLPATALCAQIELEAPVAETAPTSEDLNGVAAAADGEIIAVGDGATAEVSFTFNVEVVALS